MKFHKQNDLIILISRHRTSIDKVMAG